MTWLFPWRKSQWQMSSDLVAGLIVAILIIPQAIGYGLLAKLPPSVALASCIFPLIAYAFFGRSHALAVGPVAIISLMTGDALASLPTELIISGAQLLALQVALVLGTLRLFNLGNLVHFIGHPVVKGFTSAAAVVIISKQIPLMLNANLLDGQIPTLSVTAFSIIAIALLILLKKLPQAFISKLGPLAVVMLGGVLVYALPQSMKTIELGSDPTPFTMTFYLPWDHFSALLPNAILIALIGFLESTSVAKTLAKQRKENIHANQELLGLTAANAMAGLFQGYPVAGGFGRTMVNDQSGATSPLAGVFTAIFVGLFLVLGLSLLGYIPMAALGAIVTLAVWPLIDLKPIYSKWRVHPKENSTWLITFVLVLWQGVEIGILSGVVLSIFFLLRSAAKPHIAIIGRIPGTAHFRNIKRHKVETFDNLLAIRIDEGLHFANVEAIDTFIEDSLSTYPDIQHLLIVCSAVNIMDGDGIELLQTWHDKLLTQGKQLHLAEVKGPVMDDLEIRGFINDLKPGQVFLSTHEAFESLGRATTA
ncbi:MAG: STAS domain-containing protein [Gammaproteobacteria bacterium]|nr:STAS domain-containing protein [Gammaproteobacteria bacterium]